jgi:tetratricopeptide (TPR) repeat protein
MKKTDYIFLFLMLIQFLLRAQDTNSLLFELKHSDEKNKATILNELASANSQNDFKKSLSFGLAALHLANIYGQEKEKYNAFQNIAYAYLQQDTLDLSLLYYNKALEKAIDMGDSILIARSEFGIGTAYSHKNYYDKALEHLITSLKIIETDFEKKEDTVLNAQRLSFITNNIGVFYQRLNNTDKALEYYKYSLELKTKLNDSLGVANTLNNIGLIYSTKGEFDKAMSYYNRSLRLKQGIDDKSLIAETIFNIWELQIKQKKYSEALEYFFKKVEATGDLFNNRTKILMFNNLAEIYLAMNQTDSIYHISGKAIQLAKKINNNELLSKAYLLRSKYFFKIRDFENAYENQNNYLKIHDSILNKEMIFKFAEMQSNYEMEKKEKQIAILQKDKQQNIAKLNKQKAIKLTYLVVFLIIMFIVVLVITYLRNKQKQKQHFLEKQNTQIEQKLLRTQMNPHFIFNSLNSVQGFISSNNSLKAMSFLSKFGQLLRNMLENSRENLISLDTELETLKIYIDFERERRENSFDYSINIDDCIDPETFKVPPLIIQPFVENSIKHGLKQTKHDGFINIDIKCENSTLLIIEISDNGVGYEKSKQISTHKPSNHKSLGMELTSERLAIMKKSIGEEASFTINEIINESKEVCGTIVILRIPQKKN